MECQGRIGRTSSASSRQNSLSSLVAPGLPWFNLQDLDYEKPQVLGLASTWTQQACAIMADDGFDWEGDRPLGMQPLP